MVYQFLSSFENKIIKIFTFLANAGIDADSHNGNAGSDSDYDSDNGLPPLEKNMNHISIKESEDESE